MSEKIAVLEAVPVAALTPEERKKATQFKGKNDPRNGRRKRDEPQGEIVPIEDDGAPPLLMAMRHVFQNEKKFDKTTMERQARKYYNKDNRGFMTQMIAMEKAMVAKAGNKDEERTVDMDECMALVERLLGEET